MGKDFGRPFSSYSFSFIFRSLLVPIINTKTRCHILTLLTLNKKAALPMWAKLHYTLIIAPQHMARPSQRPLYSTLYSIDKHLFHNYNIIMEGIRFEWDENKNRINQDKHGLSFEEAKTVFYDLEAIVIDDPEHSEEEARFIVLGLSKTAHLLVVCHCYRDAESVIRIISARKATKTETSYYFK